MTGISAPAPRPCDSCPYRRDVPSGVWSAEEYRTLRRYDAETWGQPVNLFQCHQNDRDDDRARVCAGWVACHGQELLALRLAVADGRLDPSVMEYKTTVPVFRSGEAAASHGLHNITKPGKRARALIDKIDHTRGDIQVPLGRAYEKRILSRLEEGDGDA